MRKSPVLIRAALSCAYGVIVFAFLSYWHSGNTFCDGANPAGIRLHVLRLGIAIVALDLAAGLCGSTMDSLVKSDRGKFCFSPLVAAVIVGVAAWALPDFVNSDPGFFVNTPWDVTCLFYEGYGIVFIALCVPLLAGLTFVRELSVVRITRRLKLTQLTP